MSVFRASFINEIDKTYKKKKVIFIAILSAVLIILGQIAVYLIRNELGIRATGSGEFPLLVLSVFSNTILPLFTALLAIDIFSGENSNRTWKILFTRPVSRFKLISAKVCAIIFFIVALLVFVMIISTVIGVAFNSYGISLISLYKIFVAYIITVVPVTTLALLIVLLTNVFRSGISVFFISVLIFLALKGVGVFFSQYSSIFLVPNLDWYNLWIGETIQISSIIRKLLILIGADVMFFSLAYYLFDKKSI